MSALTAAAIAFVVGFMAYVAGRISKANEVDHTPRASVPLDVGRHWREGHDYGKHKGYAEGWTSGRLALVEEQQARRMHPTGSPMSDLKALDNEADQQLRKFD